MKIQTTKHLLSRIAACLLAMAMGSSMLGCAAEAPAGNTASGQGDTGATKEEAALEETDSLTGDDAEIRELISSMTTEI